MRTQVLLFVAGAALAGCGQLGLKSNDGESAARGASAPQADRDAALMRQLAQANMAEVATGKLAAAKAESPAVREYGNLMVEDHSAFLTEGNDLARAKGLPVPVSPDPEHLAVIKQLENLSGAGFDRVYLQEMVKDHEKALGVLEQAASQAADPRLREHAQKAKPQVEKHLQVARRLAGDLLGRAQ